jgi:hypothetical protein
MVVPHPKMIKEPLIICLSGMAGCNVCPMRGYVWMLFILKKLSC